MLLFRRTQATCRLQSSAAGSSGEGPPSRHSSRDRGEEQDETITCRYHGGARSAQPGPVAKEEAARHQAAVVKMEVKEEFVDDSSEEVEEGRASVEQVEAVHDADGVAGLLEEPKQKGEHEEDDEDEDGDEAPE